MFGWFDELQHGAPVRAKLTRVPPVDIARCADGARQRVSGIVESLAVTPLLVSPISGRPCLYWAVSIDEVGGMSDWIERGSTDRGQPFFVRDASGVARVMPEGARCDLPASSTTYITASALGPVQRGLFVGMKIQLNYPDTSKVRFNERVITAGTWITILGHNQHEPTQEAAATAAEYRGELPMRPVFSSSRRKPLLIGNA